MWEHQPLLIVLPSPFGRRKKDDGCTVLNIFLLLTSCGAKMTLSSNFTSCATSLKRLEVLLLTSTPGQIVGFKKKLLGST
jgi:hypothetical protein